MKVRACIAVVLLPLLAHCSQEASKPVPVVTKGPNSRTAGNNPAGTSTVPGNNSSNGTGTPAGDPTIPAGPTTQALAVAMGTMSFDLASAKAGLPGSTLTAMVAVIPGSATAQDAITLTQFTVKAPSSTGMVLYRPNIVLVGADGKDKLFALGTNITLKIPAARSVPLGNLPSITLEGIKAGDKIKLRFSALDPLANALIDGLLNYRECKSPQSLTAFQNVAREIQTCNGCHGGRFATEFISKDMATACGQNLKMIDRTLSPSGTVANIPGGHNNGGALNSALTPWRTAEGL